MMLSLRTSLLVLLPLVAVACASNTSDPQSADGKNSPATPAEVPDPASHKTGLVLLADNNRNGAIDLEDPTEQKGRDTWDDSHGAVFLANIDDDTLRCPKTGLDADLAKCFDAADDIVNGDDDLLDMAPIKTKP